ncbi:MAG: PQQ-dependent sugar dehydrogenase [Caldilineaceae bacterium]|nr:PQQ-dependent sugar dehydrogenase [Caldilineaceae bacterium]
MSERIKAFLEGSGRLRLIWLIMGALLLAGCGSPAPTATPAPVATASQTAAPTEAPSEANLLPTVTAPVAAAPTAERVAAPTFDPAQTQVVLQPVYEGFDRPVFVTHANDGSGRIFVVEKQGSIRIVRGGVVEPERFLTIRDRVTSSGNEQGLLGLAFAPNFGESGYFFVNYTDVAGDTVISRFQVDAANPDVADPNSEFLVLHFDQPARNHNGGMLAFGPDGYLWIGTGDGGGANDTYGNGQNPNTFLGKMLRLDVTSDPGVAYRIPPDNPWVDADWSGVDVLDEVWAVGLRNPWRYSFDRATGDLWIADVGQNVYEEVNYTVAGNPGGLNYGWPIMEGLHCFQGGNCDQTGLELPVVEYDHANGCSITGGYVYRGSLFPDLAGVYIFADYCSGLVWATTRGSDDVWNTTMVFESGALISSFGEDEAGELYATDLNSGVVYQVMAQ